ncbi:unnamed protein product [Brassica oleracea var. botrytis]
MFVMLNICKLSEEACSGSKKRASGSKTAGYHDGPDG